MSENSVEQEGTPEETVEEVYQEPDVSELTDEDLEKLIQGTPLEGEEEDSNQPESQQEEAVKTEGEGVEPEQQVQAESVEELQQRIRQQEERLEHQRLMIERRSTELGHLRGENRKLMSQLQEKQRDLEDDNPVEAMRVERKLEQLEKDDEALQVEQERLAAEANFMRIVPRIVKPDEYDERAIRATLADDGLSDKDINDMLATLPQQDPGMVVNLIKRAHREKALKNLVPYTKSVIKENEELRKKLGEQGNDIARSISKELNKPKTISAAKPATRKAISESTVYSASDDELDEIIKRGSSYGRNSI